MKWEDLVLVGTVEEIDSENRALARVRVLDRLSNWMPVLMFANSFKKEFKPVRKGEQVSVLSPYGDLKGGIIIRGIFNKACKEPSGSSPTKEVNEYEDGTRITYDVDSHELEVECVGTVKIVCTNATVEADSVNVIAETMSTTGDFSVGGNMTVAGTISDVKGDLTSHGHPDASSR
jgi:phage baseplate assembly protein V